MAARKKRAVPLDIIPCMPYHTIPYHTIKYQYILSHNKAYNSIQQHAKT